ncbi:hypothetical protein [Candidatus Viridilinea mediisalina]|uniref:Uncharacterized protein n=1 Tax=Candidatus Viridilinea mediisalina TaxID=2024553 RepID=A0A2A6REC4_9CHLR|nr:hypothetical protein [Candidatus Viridilinea mediisalina]PDW00820.1 hypothetical protein CJ255_20150 [Candidatus Viridilinea mediisalina]
MKIRQHPRINGILIGDEVYSHPHKLFARVADVFPAAVCVRIGVLSVDNPMEIILAPQLWRADDIENLSVCRYCGSREQIRTVSDTGIPFRVCTACSPLTSEELLDEAKG